MKQYITYSLRATDKGRTAYQIVRLSSYPFTFRDAQEVKKAYGEDKHPLRILRLPDERLAQEAIATIARGHYTWQKQGTRRTYFGIVAAPNGDDGSDYIRVICPTLRGIKQVPHTHSCFLYHMGSSFNMVLNTPTIDKDIIWD